MAHLNDDKTVAKMGTRLWGTVDVGHPPLILKAEITCFGKSLKELLCVGN
jgi:hypothetical protein